jgi:hypothetical protein
MNSKLKIQLVSLLLISLPALINAQFKWPNGAQAAVCLTYDDALDGQLDYAIPQLFSVPEIPHVYTGALMNGEKQQKTDMNSAIIHYSIHALKTDLTGQNSPG